jgi:hypothetical protein
MGIITCETHGQGGADLVSPMLRTACIEHRRVPPDQIVAVRFSVLDEYPPSIAWFDRDAAVRLNLPAERALALDDLDANDFDLEPVCGRCFGDWLRLNGVDPSPSPDEKRFTHLADLLRDSVWPRLQPPFNAVADAVRQAVHPAFVQCVSLFGRTKEMPLVASLRCIVSGNLSDDSDVTVHVACHDRLTLLQCECGIHFKDGARPALEGPHIEIAFDAGGLLQTDLEKISDWAARVAAFVTAHREGIVKEVLARRTSPL